MSSVIATLLACSLHPDDALLSSVVDAFSHQNPFTVTNVAMMSLDPRDDRLQDESAPATVAEAREVVQRLLAAGGQPVIGLLPARPEWALELGKPADALFDACSNVEVASAKLSEFDYACRTLGPTPTAARRRVCALDRYGAALGLPALRRLVVLDLPRATRELAPSEELLSVDGQVLAPAGALQPRGALVLVPASSSP
jgi:hypothetical protein